jgi:ABC-type nitrate/sulfonate/bicarbonate transport system permease component
MVSAEVMANTAKSLGGAMSYARSFLEVSRLAALTLFAILLGFIFELAFGCLKHVNDKWRAGNGN